MSRPISRTLIVIIICALFAGCTSPTAIDVSPTVSHSTISTIIPSTPLPKPVKLVYWDWYTASEGKYIDEQLQKFHDTYPWITVERNNIRSSNTYDETMKLTLGSDQQPDIFEQLRHVSLNQIEEYVMPLNKWINPDWISRFPPNTFSEGSRSVLNGNIYSFPLQHSANNMGILYLNTSLFEQAGLVDSKGKPIAPQNYSQMRDYAHRITQMCNGKCYGFGFGGKDAASAFDAILGIAQYGGVSFFSPEGFDFRTGKYVFGSSPAFSDLTHLLLDIKNDGSAIPEVVSLDEPTVQTLFVKGKVAMILGKFSVATGWRDTNPDFDKYEIAAPPFPDSGQKGGWYYNPGGNRWYMSANTKHSEEAWLLMDWFASKQFVEGWVKAGLGVVWDTKANKPEFVTNRHFADFIRLVSRLSILCPSFLIRNPDTYDVQVASVEPDWPDVFVGIYTGQLDMKSALADLDKRKQDALESAIEKAQSKGKAVSIDDFTFPDWDPMKDYITTQKSK